VLGEKEFDRLLGTPRGIDAAAAAGLFGLRHRRLTSLAELGDALAAGTGLIEVPADRRANVELHRRLNEAAGAALGA
jgi:2-succinyl-5-enolpyruvyl-6-hydroxy-3-cyclohexene-1-carboxylate synthase